MNNSSSPSRTYVMMCDKPRFDGYYFRKFKLPETDKKGKQYSNDSVTASWYFQDRFKAHGPGCFAAEDLGSAVMFIDSQ